MTPTRTFWNTLTRKSVAQKNKNQCKKQYELRAFRIEHILHKNYKYFSDILEKKTNSTGHSAASFACCVREAVDIIRKEVLVVADEVSNTDSNITTLEPID